MGEELRIELGGGGDYGVREQAREALGEFFLYFDLLLLELGRNSRAYAKGR